MSENHVHIVDIEGLFDRSKPPDPTSPAECRKRQEATDARMISMRGAQQQPLDVANDILTGDRTNSGIPDQEGSHGLSGPRNWTDADISALVERLTGEVNRADAVPFRKNTPAPRNPSPRPPETEYGVELRKLRLSNPAGFAKHLDNVANLRDKARAGGRDPATIDGLAELRKIAG